MKKILLTTVSVLALATPVLAADVVEPAAFDWTGAYVGANAGASFFKDDLELENPFSSIGSVSSNDSETDVTFGVQAGFNFQSDSLLFGVEGDFNYLDAGDDLFLQGKPNATWESDHDWFATIRARAGLVSDRALFYITGGVAFLDATYELTALGLNNNASSDSVLTGWTIGGGIEYAFSEDWSAKIEYIYADFESVDESVVTFTTITGSADPSLQVVRAGLNYHF